MLIWSLYLTLCSIFLLFGDQALCISKTKDVDSQTQLVDRLNQLNELSDRNVIIRLNGKRFETLIKTPPRNYSVIAMLTTLQSHRQCHVCRQAKEEFEIMANSWRYGTSYVSGIVYFGLLDYDESPDVFNWLGINSVPQFVHFPPKGKPKRQDTMDVYRVGFSADAIARFVTEKTAIQIRINRPPDYSNTILFAGLIIFIAGLIYVKRKNLEFFYNKSAWGALTLSILFMMTSGQMWNHIRSPPFMEKDRTGNVIYVHPWSDSQFVAETYIVFALNAAVVAGFILLSEARSMKSAAGKKRVVAICALGSVIFFFSLLLSIFRSKHQGYPYSFLLK